MIAWKENAAYFNVNDFSIGFSAKCPFLECVVISGGKPGDRLLSLKKPMMVLVLQTSHGPDF